MNIYLESVTILNFILMILLGDAVYEKTNAAAYKEAKKGKKADRAVMHILVHVMDYWTAAGTIFALGSFVDLLKHPYWNHIFSYVATLVALAAMVMLLAYMTRYFYRVSNGRERSFEKVIQEELTVTGV